MAQVKNPVERIRKKYQRRVKTIIHSDALFTELFHQIQATTNKHFGGIMRKESKRFDPEFINFVEKYLPSLERIAKNPRLFIKETHEVVPVELAKKIGPAAIQHLAQHSELVKEYRDNGEVIPDRILGTFVEEEIAIYENRFVMTLIRKLALFIEMRYRYIDEHGDTLDSDVLTIKTLVPVGKSKFEFETKIKLSVPSDDEGYRKTNDDLLFRLKTLRQKVTFLVNSPFMKALRKATPITGKVQMTNLLRTNKDYRAAYELWLFVGRYDALGVTYSIKERKMTFEDEYLRELNAFIMGGYLALRTDKAVMNDRRTSKWQITPRFTKPILDKDISDDRFLEHLGMKPVALHKLTAAQLAAKKKREIEKEKARLQKIAAKEKAMALAKARAEREKQRKIELKQKKQAMLRLKKEEALAKKKAAREALRLKREESLRIKALKAAELKRLADERARLKAEREKVKKTALAKKKKAAPKGKEHDKAPSKSQS